ncbi:MAG: hypothetical protein M3Y53_00885 [Thermoproteota archaeon]|nr:hypothetical protein [Thermoproteota archaeon]
MMISVLTLEYCQKRICYVKQRLNLIAFVCMLSTLSNGNTDITPAKDPQQQVKSDSVSSDMSDIKLYLNLFDTQD